MWRRINKEARMRGRERMEGGKEERMRGRKGDVEWHPGPIYRL